MKVLVIGSGGREHALVWKISQSPKVRKIYCAPGNAGIAKLASLVPENSDDIEALLSFAKKESIDLTVVGPEAPLINGIVSRFESEALNIFGPRRRPAMLEGSKSFAKYIMNKYNIPTAKSETFTDSNLACKYINEQGAPIVVKADGLAAGKGVFVCKTEEEAISAVNTIMVQKAFGNAGEKIIIEECLTGEEASFLAITDGKTILPLPSSQDHKPVFDNDQGPNTGGMGAYSPAPVVDKIIHEKVMNEIMIPTVKAMAAEGPPYKGILYAGLMINGDQIKVLEFNARFGDPECQPLLMRIKNDIVDIFEAVIEGRLDQYELEIDPKASVCVVMAQNGYPGSYTKGNEIKGLEKFDTESQEDCMVFHAGTSLKDEKIVTNGGRVLGVTALGDTIENAISNAYSHAKQITWDGCFYRKDIGKKAIDILNKNPLVSIVMGSDSDFPIMMNSATILKKFNIPFEITVASAHRTPEKVIEMAKTAKDRGIKVFIAGAGMAAHLAGVIASNTILPVLGVPINSSPLNGMDSLLSTVQMPPGVPVAALSIGKAGAKNAGILAAQIIANFVPEIEKQLIEYKNEMAAEVLNKAKNIMNI